MGAVLLILLTVSVPVLPLVVFGVWAQYKFPLSKRIWGGALFGVLVGLVLVYGVGGLSSTHQGLLRWENYFAVNFGLGVLAIALVCFFSTFFAFNWPVHGSYRLLKTSLLAYVPSVVLCGFVFALWLTVGMMRVGV